MDLERRRKRLKTCGLRVSLAQEMIRAGATWKLLQNWMQSRGTQGKFPKEQTMNTHSYTKLHNPSPLPVDQYVGDHQGNGNGNGNNGNNNWQDSLFLFVAIFFFFWLLSVWRRPGGGHTSDYWCLRGRGALNKNKTANTTRTLNSSHRHTLAFHFLTGGGRGRFVSETMNTEVWFFSSSLYQITSGPLSSTCSLFMQEVHWKVVQRLSPRASKPSQCAHSCRWMHRVHKEAVLHDQGELRREILFVFWCPVLQKKKAGWSSL